MQTTTLVLACNSLTKCRSIFEVGIHVIVIVSLRLHAVFAEIPVNFGVGIRVIVNVFLKLLVDFAEILLALTGREGVETVGFGGTAVARPIKDNRGLLLVGHGGL